MQHSSSPTRFWATSLLAFSFVGAAACSAADGSPGADESGGAPGSGGALGKGGLSGVGGASAGGLPGAGGTSVPAGGFTGVGGASSAGGGPNSGGTTGEGGAPSGGAYGSGGLVGESGGTASGGGGTSSGGSSSSGGAQGSGGNASGGAPSTGGAQSTGGAPPALKKFCGNITTGGQVRSDFVEYWDQITPENEGKWGSVEGTRDRMNWAGLDRAYQYAKQHGIPFKQHTFVWGSQQPNWIASLPQSEQRAEVEEWIRLYCERYPDTQMIDVVNEPPPHTTPSYTAALGGTGSSGFDWIVQSFRWARQYCPKAVLILNDYNTIEYGNDNARFVDIVKKIRAAGAPIDAIGAQAHAAFSIPNSTVRMYLDRLIATGLPVYISEYDIDLADSNRQREVMQSQFTMFWNDPNIKGVTIWGYVQGQTWLPNTGLMSSSGTQRPAMTWLMDYLKR